MIKLRTLFRGLVCLFTFLLVVSVLASWIFEENKSMIDQTTGSLSTVFVTDENAGALFKAFTPDEEFLTNGKLDMDKNVAIHRDLSVRLQEAYCLKIRHMLLRSPMRCLSARKNPKI